MRNQRTEEKGQKPKNKLNLIGEFTNTLNPIPEDIRRTGFEVYNKISSALCLIDCCQLENIKVAWWEKGNCYDFISTFKINIRVDCIHSARKHHQITIEWHNQAENHSWKDEGKFIGLHQIFLIQKEHSGQPGQPTVKRGVEFGGTISDHQDYVAKSITGVVLETIQTDILSPVNTYMEIANAQIKSRIQEITR